MFETTNQVVSALLILALQSTILPIFWDTTNIHGTSTSPSPPACEGLHFRRGKEGTALEAPGMRHPPASVHLDR